MYRFGSMSYIYDLSKMQSLKILTNSTPAQACCPHTFTLNVNILSQVVQLHFSIQSKHPALHGSPLNGIQIQVAAALDAFQSCCSKLKNQDCHNYFTIHFLLLPINGMNSIYKYLQLYVHEEEIIAL